MRGAFFQELADLCKKYQVEYIGDSQGSAAMVGFADDPKAHYLITFAQNWADKSEAGLRVTKREYSDEFFK